MKEERARYRVLKALESAVTLEGAVWDLDPGMVVPFCVFYASDDCL